MTIILDSSGTPREVTNWGADEIIKQRETIAALKKQRDELESTLRMEETISFRRQMQEYAAQCDELLADMKLILSAEGRGFGIDYIKGCARAAIANVKEQK